MRSTGNVTSVVIIALSLFLLDIRVAEAKTNTTTVVASSVNPSTYGQSVTLTATVSPSDATGTVTFKRGSSTLGTGTLSDGTATFTTATLSRTSHSITAVYGGDSNYNASTSPALTQTVIKADSITEITSSMNPSLRQASVTFTATVSPSTATGSVTFKNGATTLGTRSLSGGTASYSTSSLAAGTHSITASYGGSTNYITSVSPTLMQTVNKIDTTTTLTSAPNPSVRQSSVTFTATVSPSTATGSITFKNGATTLGTRSLSGGTASYSTSSLAAGTHSITASYAGTTTYNSSASQALLQTVNKIDTTTTLTSAPNPSTWPAYITLRATVSPSSAPGTVTFMDGATVLGTRTLTSGQAVFYASALPAGSYSIVAVYEGDANYNGSTSDVILHTVNKAASTTTVTSSPNPSILQSLVSINATVSPATATGLVTFMDGDKALGVRSLVNGTATLSTAALALGTHSITAVYGGDGNVNGSSSPVRTQTVNKPGTTITLESSANPSIHQTDVTFTAAISPMSATGSITFRDGSTILGTNPIIDGVASYTTAALSAGSHYIYALYDGDDSYEGSTSYLEHIVKKPATTTTLTSSANPSAYQASVSFTVTVSPSTATGTVTFKDGSATLGTRTLSGGQATYTTSSLAVGVHPVTAVYGGNLTYAGSTSASLMQTVGMIESIAITPDNLELPYHSIQRFRALATFSDQSIRDVTAYVTWSTSDSRVATIDSTALLTGVMPGQTEVRATLNSLTGSTGLIIRGRSFVPAGRQIQYRSAHSATLLPDNTVLVAGGIGGYIGSGDYDVLNSSEIYDPANRSFAANDQLGTARAAHSATLLPDGKVLLAGGITPIGGGYTDETVSAELYDFATGLFTTAGSLRHGRSSHTATLLPDGKVLLAGGYYQNYGTASAELYDPATGTFALTGSLSIARGGATATLLNNGTVLIVGGRDSFDVWNTTEIYDPASGVFLSGPNLPTPLYGHEAVLLADGKVLIIGGKTDYGGPATPNLLLYDPTTQTFSVSASLSIARGTPSATILSDGRVLITSGYYTDDQTYITAEIYDPTNQTCIGAGATANHGAPTLLSDGSVLVIGGGPEGIAERYGEAFPTPESLQITPTTVSMVTGGVQQFAVLDDLGFERPDAIWTISDSGVASFPSDSNPTITALNPGSAILRANIDGVIAEAHISTAPYSLKITPASATMMVGEERQFSVIDERGLPCPSGSWTISDENLATIEAGDLPTIVALAPGTITLSVTIEGVFAEAQITIIPASQDGSYPAGTVLWSAAPTIGYFPAQIVRAMPSPGAPDFYSIQSDGGSHSLIQAYSGGGQQMWETVVPAVNDFSVPTSDGGLLVTHYQTCEEGQTLPMTIAKLHPETGQSVWQIQAQPTNIGGTNYYCYPEAPQMAVRPNGSVVIASPGNTSGLPELMIVRESTGQILASYTIPPSTYEDVFGQISEGYSPIGPPFVASDGTAYVEYEVRNMGYDYIGNRVHVTSAELWLMKIDPVSNSSNAVVLSSTTEDMNIFPGRIIPDNEGGVVATWYVHRYYAPGMEPEPPLYPYYAAHVIGGSVGPAYRLPFGVDEVNYGRYPTLALGENGTAFATDGENSDYGPTIASFDLDSGAVHWTHQAAPSDTLSILTSLENNDLVAKIVNNTESIVQFSSEGSLVSDLSLSGYELFDFAAGDAFVASSSYGPIAMIASGEQKNLPNSVNPAPVKQNAAERKIYVRVYQLDPDADGVLPVTINMVDRVDSAITYWRQKGILMSWPIGPNGQENKTVSESPLCSRANCMGFPDTFLSLHAGSDETNQIPYFHAYFRKTKGLYYIFINNVVGGENKAATLTHRAMPTEEDPNPRIKRNVVVTGRSVDDVLPHETGHAFNLHHVYTPTNLMCGKGIFPICFSSFTGLDSEQILEAKKYANELKE